MTQGGGTSQEACPPGSYNAVVPKVGHRAIAVGAQSADGIRG